MRTYNKEKNVRDREKISAINKARYAANPGPALARSKARNILHKDDIRAYNIARYAGLDKTEEAARTKAYRDANPGVGAARAKKWNAENGERRRAIVAKCSKHHPEHHIAKNHKRRSAPGDFTSAEWRALKNKHDYRCIDCGMQEGHVFAQGTMSGKVMKLTVGHAHPIKQGGSNWIANIIPQCWPCNLAQGTNMHRSLIASAEKARNTCLSVSLLR